MVNGVRVMRDAVVRGFAKTLDVAGPVNSPVAPQSKIRYSEDARALASDWMAVGNDIQTAAAQFDKGTLQLPR